jgi:2-methylcitrate dehydratase
LAEELCGYATKLSYDDLPASAIREAKRRILDTIGCAIAAFDGPPVKIARKMALDLRSKRPSVILGTNRRTSADMAAFVNVTMGRYLNFNDGYHGKEGGQGKEGGRVGDNIGTCLSVSDFMHKSGRDLILSVILAYEIQCRFADAGEIQRKGWDSVNYTLISSTVAAAKLMGCSVETMSEALNISINAHISLKQVRAGTLSMWPACAPAEAARCSVFAVLLANAGMTGPRPIFEGEFGFFKQVAGQIQLDISKFGRTRNFKIGETYLKMYPAEGGTQSTIWAAMQARRKIPDIGKISKIEIAVTKRMYESVSSHADRMSPKTHESADHSLPYLVAVALIDGVITNMSYDSGKLTDPSILALMKKMTIKEDSYLTAEFPNEKKSVLMTYLTNGDAFSEGAEYARGHPKNPATDAEIEGKFRANARGFLGPGQTNRIIDLVWNLENLDDVSRLLETCVVKRRV